MDLQQQYATLVLMMLSGATMGTVHDVYRTAIKEWRFLRRFSALWDILYWLVATVFVFTMLLGANHGEVRFAVFLLLGAGWWLYALVLRRLVVAVTTTVIRAILSVMRWVWYLIFRMLILPIVVLLKFMWITAKRINQMMEKIEIVLVWPIAFTGKSVARYFEKKEDDDEGTNN